LRGADCENTMTKIAALILLLAVTLDGVAQQLPFGDLPRGVVTPSFGCAASANDEEARTACAVSELRFVDGRLNERYEQLRQRLQPDERKALLAAQREWMKKRDRECDVESRTPDRDLWLQQVALSEALAHCILHATQKRIAELEEMYQRATTPPVFAEVLPRTTPLSSSTAMATGPAKDGYVIRSAASRQRGKYYFEVVIDQAAAREKLEAMVTAHVSDGRRSMGTSYHIRPRDVALQLGSNSSVTIVGGNLGEIRLPKVVLGVAVDLEQGRLYRHRDNTWLQNAVPGSPDGVPLRRDAAYKAEVTSSVTLEPLLQQGVVAVNFGSSPFQRPPPPGYRGFDSAENGPDTLTSNEPVAVYSPNEVIAGEAQEQWLRRYWEWARSFGPAENPSTDKNGYRCGAGQSGPVWFLTGSRESASVVRECEVPEGKILLVPLINALVQANPGADVGCDRMLVTLRQFSSGITGLRFAANGTSSGELERFQLGTGCFTLRDASMGHTGMAAGTGYWLFIKPLKKGKHELTFGARSTRDNFQQDIKYVLHVR
jgi:uncharacterized protein YecT (DUF1311 family)